MSGPLKSLKKATKLPNGKQIFSKMMMTNFDKRASVLRNNADELEVSVATWQPPATFVAEDVDFFTTKDNYSWRKARAVMTLKYLLEETSELVQQPELYIFDIRHV